MPRVRYTRAQRALEAFDRDAPRLIAVDTETTGVAWHDEPFAATVTWRRIMPAWELGGLGPDEPIPVLESHYFELKKIGGAPAQALSAMLTANPAPTLVFHNAKFDLQKLILAGILDRADLSPERFENTETIAHLLDENRRKALKELAVTELGYDDTIEVEIKSGPNKGQMRKVPREKHELDSVRRKLKLRKEDGYEPLPRRVVIPYALRDTEFTLQLFEKLHPQLQAAGPALEELYLREKELELALLDMEAAGMGMDVPVLEALQAEYREKRFEAELTLRESTGMPDLNPGSWQQLLEALAAVGINVESTDEATLKRIDHPLARQILEYRHSHKLLATYIDNLIAETRGGIWHPWFNPNRARTGRMSASSAMA